MMNIAEGIYWTGYVDWDLRNFHGYSTPFGSTYNAYLILDEQPALIDTVKNYGLSRMLSRIREIIDPAKIKYIISNHTEMDHSGSISQLLKFCPQAQVVCSPKGKEGLLRHFKQDWKFKVVNTGDSLNIGERTLEFFLTPMVHWPDSMVTYSSNESAIFSNDVFGQHYASHERYVEEIGADIIFKEAAKYYANIVMPYGAQVQKALATLGSLNPQIVCPSHGLIYRKREYIDKIISLYGKWSRYESDNKVVIVYDTMWHSTEKMAIRLYELLDRENIPVKLMSLQTYHISDVVTEVMLSKFLCVGSPILNNHTLPTMGKFLTYLKGLKPKNRLGFTFGSYGWSKLGFKELESALIESEVSLKKEGKYFKFVPETEEIEQMGEIVKAIISAC